MLVSLIPEAGSFVDLDRGFTDFARLYALHQRQAFFVIRAKSNLACRRVYSHPVDKATGLRLDQTVALAGYYKAKDYPQHLRRIKFYEAEHDQNLVFLTNNLGLPALTVAQLYRCRWQAERFFNPVLSEAEGWIKQCLRIKASYGTTENAVKTQIRIAITVYVLVAAIKKRLNLDASPYTTLQVLSLTLFEKTTINQLLTNTEYNDILPLEPNQLNLFD